MLTKLLHTSDWHLGARFYGEDLTAEYQAFFTKLELTVKRFKPEGLLISGDLFDKPLPPRAVVELFQERMARVHAAYRPMRTVIIAGNHDSGEWLEEMAPQWVELGITVVGTFQRNARYFELGRHVVELPSCVIAAAPYPTSTSFPSTDEASKEEQYAHFITALTERIKLSMVQPKPMVLMAHCYLRSKEFPRYSAKDTIGVTDLPSDYAYVAMGHAHSAKAVDQQTIRYCGSPWPITANEHKPRSLAAVSISPGQPAKVQLKQLQNIVPLRLVPDHPRECATVLKHLKELPENEPCFIALNVKRSSKGNLNDRLFVNDALAAVQNKRVKICSVFWTDKTSSPTMTTLMREADQAEELRYNLLLPLRKQTVELYQTAQGLSDQLGLLVKNRRDRLGGSKAEVNALRQAFQALVRNQEDLRLAEALRKELSQLKERMEHPDYQWEERAIKALQDGKWLNRLKGSDTGKSKEAALEPIQKEAERLAEGVWQLQQRDEDLAKRKEELQKQLQTKEGSRQAATLSNTLKQVKQNYGQVHRDYEMAFSRLKELDGLLGTFYAVKGTARRKVDNLIGKLDSLLKRCKEALPKSDEKKTMEALHAELDGLLRGITGVMPGLFLTEWRFKAEFYQQVITQHNLDKQRKGALQQELDKVTKRLTNYQASMGAGKPADLIWEKVEKLVRTGFALAEGEQELLQSLAKGIAWEEKGLNELHKALNKASDQFDHTSDRACCR